MNRTRNLGRHGVPLSKVPNPIKLGHTCGPDEEVDGCERVVDGSDDERVADLNGGISVVEIVFRSALFGWERMRL